MGNEIIFGYARISTPAQNLDMQIDALIGFGVKKENIITDIACGATEERPGLNSLMEKLRSGDRVVVWQLSRIGRGLKHLLTLFEIFDHMGVDFKSIQEPFLDTKSPEGRLMFNIFGSLNQYQREMNRERTITGLEAARKRGRVGGRPPGLSKKLLKKSKAVAEFYKSGVPIDKIAEFSGISKPSIYKCLKHEGVKLYGPIKKKNTKKSNKNE